MSRVVVIALQQPFVVGTGSNDRNTLHRGSQRQYPVIGQQDDRLCDGLTGQRALLRCLECPAGGFRVNIGVLEEPELKFEAKHTPNGCVNDLKRHPSSLDLGFQWRSIAVRSR